MIEIPSPYMWQLAVVGFAACLTARLGRTWHYWLGAGIVCFGAYLYGVNVAHLVGSESFGKIGAGMLLGIFGPEIWEMLRGLARRAKTWGYIGLVILGLIVVANPQIVGSLLLIAGVLIGLKWAWRKLR